MLAFQKILTSAEELVFQCIDDLEEIPADVDAVICGGGDIINDYFMSKVQRVLRNYTGTVYAVSVGIPYLNGVKYLHMFDHVFTRSKTDCELAAKEIGSRNVTCCLDATLILQAPTSQYDWQQVKKRIAICLAQPLFYNNSNSKAMVQALVSSFGALYDANQDIEYHFVPFNYSMCIEESDRIIHHMIAEQLRQNNVPCIEQTFESSDEALVFLSSCHMALCTRYHSIIYCNIAKIPFAAMYTTQKVQNLLVDLARASDQDYHLPVDDAYMPIGIDTNTLCQYLDACYKGASVSRPNTVNMQSFQSLELINKYICEERRISEMLIPNKMLSFSDAITSCRRSLSKYFGMDMTTFDDLLHKRQKFPLRGKDPINVARFICFLISERTHHPCVWGLSENLKRDNFCLYEAVEFIWNCCKLSHDTFGKQQFYYPHIPNLKRKVLLNLDYIFQNDFSSYHRSGWSYVVGGMMNLDGPQLLKSSDILLDTYVDRSFHWGFEVLVATGVLPYRKPWYGFIHHTFDTTHSDYNCVELLKNPVFHESLLCCRGLLVLTKTLGIHLRQALREKGFSTPVYILYHPMEFIDNTFTPDRFLNNPHKKIVQIGAWLRNPYALYEMPLSRHAKIQKVALKGKEMDQYFAPPGFLCEIDNLLLKHKWIKKDEDVTVSSLYETMSRSICRVSPQNVNKFSQGFYDMTVRQLASVQVLDKLNNDDYDNLLAENIVFLNLVDCSAVNTVIECIVRNTPLIVNRHPAIEEILGLEYPGFYDSLVEAARLCEDVTNIVKVHEYMKTLDKTRYKLDVFLEHLQNIVANSDNCAVERLEMFMRPEMVFSTPPIPLLPDDNVAHNPLHKYTAFSRYLPRKWGRYIKV